MHFFNYSAILLFMTPTGHTAIMVLISAVCQWLLGALWFGLIFRKHWLKLAGFTEGSKPKNVAFGMVVSFIACLLLSYVIAHIEVWAGTKTFSGGFGLGVVLWTGFIAPPLLTQHIYENRRVNLFAINAAYWLLAMGLGGSLLAVFHG
ncbi:MAG: DUF1761 domain-containing protein [Terracidiphilus sp.]